MFEEMIQQSRHILRRERERTNQSETDHKTQDNVDPSYDDSAGFELTAKARIYHSRHPASVWIQLHAADNVASFHVNFFVGFHYYHKQDKFWRILNEKMLFLVGL